MGAGGEACQGRLVQQFPAPGRTESGLALEKGLQRGASKTSPCTLCFSYIGPSSILHTCLHVMHSRGPLQPKFWDPELEGVGKNSQCGKDMYRGVRPCSPRSRRKAQRVAVGHITAGAHFSPSSDSQTGVTDTRPAGMGAGGDVRWVGW